MTNLFLIHFLLVFKSIKITQRINGEGEREFIV